MATRNVMENFIVLHFPIRFWCQAYTLIYLDFRKHNKRVYKWGQKAKHQSLGEIKPKFVLAIKWQTPALKDFYLPTISKKAKLSRSFEPLEAEYIRKDRRGSGRDIQQETAEINNKTTSDLENLCQWAPWKYRPYRIRKATLNCKAHTMYHGRVTIGL